MRIVSAALCFLITFSVFVSCKKEKSFEVGAQAVGSLGDSSGNCLFKRVVGTYIAGTALSDSNYLELDVDVSSAGAYTISTDTLNGYAFSGSGTFSHTGINRIRLAASGTPLADKEDLFDVLYGTSICTVPVTVLPAGSANGPAAFTLQGSGDTCMMASVAGNYVQNVALTSANTVSIRVNATAAGTYTIATNNVNEFSFSGSGVIAAPGEQTLTLQASGTPATEGATVFTVTAGNTTCTFTVVAAPSGDTPPPVGTGDLFPLSANSYWTYNTSSDSPDDTMQVTNTGPVPMGSKTYQALEFADTDGTFDIAYSRKDGDNYYEYTDLSEDYPIFDADVTGETLFLKENLAAGDTWNSDFDGQISGADAKLRFVFTCTSANTTESVNGKTFGGVYKITTNIQTGIAGVFTDLGSTVETYYAKGVGLIYQKQTQGTEGFERKIRYWEVK